MAGPGALEPTARGRPVPRCDLEILLPVVIVLVGPGASGKSRLRNRLVTAGLDESLVVSLDDTRLWLRDRSLAAGRPVQPLHAYTPVAARIAASRCQALLAQGRGYLSDNTNLSRRDRLPQVAAARRAGMEAIALLTPAVSLETLRHRNVLRAEHLRVPEAVLMGQYQRRDRLRGGSLLEEGFSAVCEIGDGAGLSVRDATPPGL